MHASCRAILPPGAATTKCLHSNTNSKSAVASVATKRNLQSRTSRRTGSPTASAATAGPLESHCNIETPTKPHPRCAPSHGFCAVGDASTCTLCNVTDSARNRAIADQSRWDLYLKEYEENCRSPGVQNPHLPPGRIDFTDDEVADLIQIRRKVLDEGREKNLEMESEHNLN